MTKRTLLFSTPQEFAAYPIRMLEGEARRCTGKRYYDMAILCELYDEIKDMALKEYSGLDDVVLGRMIRQDPRVAGY